MLATARVGSCAGSGSGLTELELGQILVSSGSGRYWVGPDFKPKVIRISRLDGGDVLAVI